MNVGIPAMVICILQDTSKVYKAGLTEKMILISWYMILHGLIF